LSVFAFAVTDAPHYCAMGKSSQLQIWNFNLKLLLIVSLETCLQFISFFLGSTVFIFSQLQRSVLFEAVLYPKKYSCEAFEN